jgi:hypothetical protein
LSAIFTYCSGGSLPQLLNFFPAKFPPLTRKKISKGQVTDCYPFELLYFMT